MPSSRISLSPSNEVKRPLPFQAPAPGLPFLSLATNQASVPFLPFLPPTSNQSSTTLTLPPFVTVWPLRSQPVQPLGQATVNRPALPPE